MIATVLPSNVYGTVSTTAIMVAGIGEIREDMYALTGCFTLHLNRFGITLPSSHSTHFALVPKDPTEYCHQWSLMLDLQVTFMVRPAQKQCSVTMIMQNAWIAFLSKQKEQKNA